MTGRVVSSRKPLGDQQTAGRWPYEISGVNTATRSLY